MYIFWSRFVYVVIYGYLYKSGLIVLLNYFRLCFCVCWVYGSATLPGTSHYLDRGEGMLTLRGVRGVTLAYDSLIISKKQIKVEGRKMGLSPAPQWLS